MVRFSVGTRAKRYGLKLKRHIPGTGALVVLAVILGTLLLPGASGAQGSQTWWGSSAWFDWSDFRAAVGVRAMFPRLVSGTLEARGRSDDLRNFGIVEDPELFRLFWVELYVDRLGIRLHVEEEHKFRGRLPLEGGPTEAFRVSELNISTPRVGLDLDVIRYPFLRVGINYDYQLQQVEFKDRRSTDPNQWMNYDGSQPMTIGLHVKAFPMRLRDVPVILQGRIRFPLPFLHRYTEAKIMEWELSGGLRPPIWHTSLYGHATVSFSIEAGFRSTTLDVYARQSFNPVGGGLEDTRLHAVWQGFFLQFGAAF
jgi:hypothetical protein